MRKGGKQKGPEQGLGTVGRDKGSSTREKRKHAAKLCGKARQGASKTLAYSRSLMRPFDKHKYLE